MSRRSQSAGGAQPPAPVAPEPEPVAEPTEPAPARDTLFDEAMKLVEARDARIAELESANATLAARVAELEIQLAESQEREHALDSQCDDLTTERDAALERANAAMRTPAAPNVSEPQEALDALNRPRVAVSGEAVRVRVLTGLSLAHGDFAPGAETNALVEDLVGLRRGVQYELIEG